MVKYLAVFVFMIASVVYSKDVYVKGYFKKNGTYVSPYVRSSPDSFKWNNYGSPGASDFGGGSPYFRDSDGDGISNRFDMDDDNNGRMDDLE